MTQDHLNPTFDLPGAPTSVGMIDHVIAAGTPGEVFEPRHTTHGFQFARIEGHPGPLTTDDVTGVVVHTDLRRTGWFRCSDERINALHDITEWSFRDNACEIPTDCPQRERAGWTGDWQLFIPTAAFLYDVAGFSLKWLRDLAAEQLEDGCVTNYVPGPLAVPGHFGRVLAQHAGVVGMGGCHRDRPLGDVAGLRRRGRAGRALAAHGGLGRLRRRRRRARSATPSRAAARPEPAPHEQYLWDGGYHWGEWLEPGVVEHEHRTKDHGSVGTAFLHRSAGLAARIGRMLGHDAEADRFEELAADALDAYRKEFVGPDGSLTPDTQANHVRALAYDLVPDGLRRADGGAPGASWSATPAPTSAPGFLATPFLLPVLADTGHLDVAYELLAQDTPPSWLYMVERGATTVWESWEGIDADGVPHASLNHYSKGAVVSFLHRYVAGIQLLDEHPAYRHFRVEPRPGGGLTWAEAVHDSPYGRIESSWRTRDGTFRLTVASRPGRPPRSGCPTGPGSTRARARGRTSPRWPDLTGPRPTSHREHGHRPGAVQPLA